VARRKPIDIGQLKVRLPEELRERLEQSSERSGRSLNNEIVWRLGQSFEEKRPREALLGPPTNEPLEGIRSALRAPPVPEPTGDLTQDPRFGEAVRKIVAAWLEGEGKKYRRG
jgi:hypothetical protein